MEWARSASAESVHSRKMYHAYNVPIIILLTKYALTTMTLPKISSMRADDHSTIGATLFALLTPAIFWNRARLIHCKLFFFFSLFLQTSTDMGAVILGGSGIGSSIGLLAHYGRTVSGDPALRTEMPGHQIAS
jgi:hypothetical protein